jgi:hypothetical protein
MAKLQAVTNATLGFLGLNTQDNGVTLDSGFATRATNCIIDKNGRLSSRKGWQMVTTNNGDLSDTESIETIYEILSVGGSSTVISAGGGKIFTGTTTLTRLNVYGTDASGPAVLSPQPTFNGNRWQWCTLQEGSTSGNTVAETYAIVTQRNNTAMVYREGAHSGPFVLQKIDSATGYGTKPDGVTTFDPDCCHAAFGRVWVAGLTENRTTVFYSQLLAPATFTGTGSGVLDISSKVGGNDEIVAISSHNGYLIIFCKRNILVYANPDSPSTITLADVIPGVGCIARDSVQQTGNDIIFLSASGVRSLSRTVQEKSMPMRELSINIRDDLVQYISTENTDNIKSVYFEKEAFYLLVLPSLNQVYYFDLRRVLENGGARVTSWTNIVPKALFVTSSRNLLLGMAGGIATYSGYLDGTSGYRMEYYTTNTTMGADTTLKFLKKSKITVIGAGNQQFVIKYGFDYSPEYSSRATLKQLSGTPYEYSNAVTFTGSRSGSTLTTTNNPALTIGMAVYTVTGTSLGTITAGGDNTWTLSSSGTVASQAMIAAIPGGSEYTNFLGQTGYVGTEYSGGVATFEIDTNLGGSGKVLQFGIEAPINGSPLNIQQMTVYLTTGKMI